MRGAEFEPAWAGLDLGAYSLATEVMTASEQMFFLGSPLAHVLRYEHELRGERKRREGEVAHGRRLYAGRQAPDQAVRLP